MVAAKAHLSAGSNGQGSSWGNNDISVDYVRTIFRHPPDIAVDLTGNCGGRQDSLGQENLQRKQQEDQENSLLEPRRLLP
jgi:hypothetical protein